MELVFLGVFNSQVGGGLALRRSQSEWERRSVSLRLPHPPSRKTAAQWALSALLLLRRRLLLSIIRRPNVTDDEKDRKSQPRDPRRGKKKKKKKRNQISSFVRQARFCSRVELSAVSAAPRSASKIMGHGCGGLLLSACCGGARRPVRTASRQERKRLRFAISQPSFLQQSSNSRYLSPHVRQCETA